jgi:hypothetical protein
MADMWKAVTDVVDCQYVSCGVFCGKRHDLIGLVQILGQIILCLSLPGPSAFAFHMCLNLWSDKL